MNPKEQLRSEWLSKANDLIEMMYMLYSATDIVTLNRLEEEIAKRMEELEEMAEEMKKDQ